MFKIALTTAFVAVSMSFAMSGGAMANGEDEFRERCENAGGTFNSDGDCEHSDGSIEQCSFGEDDWMCYRSEPAPKSIFKGLGKLINVPVKKTKMPTPPGPVETERSIKIFGLKSPNKIRMSNEAPAANDGGSATNEMRATPEFNSRIEKLDLSTQIETNRSLATESVISAPTLNFGSSETMTLKLNR